MTTRAFVVGHPIAHSRSPLIHGHWLEQLGLSGSYERVDVSPEGFPGFLQDLLRLGFTGGNVTLPHKEAAYRLVDHATAHASRVGAVNTVWRAYDGGLWGDNTDGAGFLASLDQALGPSWTHGTQTALILGAGGAARAIVAALLDRGLARIVIANRTEAAAREVAGLAPDRIAVVPQAELAAALPAADLLVNTTQLGMKGQPPLVVDVERLPDGATVADIVYVPLETALLRAARGRGLRTVGGLGMLLHQAVPGFERWFGVRPEVTAELRALVEADVERSA